MTTVNGCWNCEHGGLEKLLVNLIYSQKAFRRVTPTANVKTVSRKCGINATLNVEPGFICESWKYDERGYKAKEPSYTEDKIMQER